MDCWLSVGLDPHTHQNKTLTRERERLSDRPTWWWLPQTKGICETEKARWSKRGEEISRTRISFSESSFCCCFCRSCCYSDIVIVIRYALCNVEGTRLFAIIINQSKRMMGGTLGRICRSARRENQSQAKKNLQEYDGDDITQRAGRRERGYYIVACGICIALTFS